MKRRYFILGGVGSVGALVIGWTALPIRSRLNAHGAPKVSSGQVALNGWVKVGADDRVTVMMSQVEMGQGAQTGLAMLVAEEMGASWQQIRLEQAGFDPIYNNQAAIVDSLPFGPDQRWIKSTARHVVGKFLREIPGLAVTGSSSSICDQWLPLREAGAAARELLVGAAAAAWNVPVGECRAAEGRVTHPSGKSANFSELAPAAAERALRGKIELKDPSNFTLIGRPTPRLDSPSKVDGSAAFGIDARPPGLLFAGLRMCPTVGGEVANFDASAALKLPGVRSVMALGKAPGGLGGNGDTSGGIAAIADTSWSAMRALERVTVQWDLGGAAAVSTRSMLAQIHRALDEERPHVRRQSGDVEAAIKAAAIRIEAEYSVPMLAHATLEPMNCTVQLKDGAATVWAGCQMPGIARAAAAKALGIAKDRVDLRVPYLGGGFGRRALTDMIVQACLIARTTAGAPVQLIWSREQDMTHDFYRPAYVARCRAALDAHGKLTAWQITSAGSSMGAPSMLDTTTDGAADTAYAFANSRIAHLPVDPGVPVGIWRSVAHSQNAFFTECLMDEAAAAAGSDPIEFRAALLAADARHLRVLRRAAELSGWGQPIAAAADGAPRARGVAIHRSFGSIVAQVAEVSMSGDGRVRVHRVVCVIDCGIPVNPNLIRQQVESAIIFGLSAALYGEITLDRGEVQQSNFDGYSVLRLEDCPAIETDIIPSREPPRGVGEVATPPIAPAVANAVFKLTGRRLRNLPLRPQAGASA